MDVSVLAPAVVDDVVEVSLLCTEVVVAVAVEVAEDSVVDWAAAAPAREPAVMAAAAKDAANIRDFIIDLPS